MNDSLGMLTTAVNCDTSREKALEAARPVAAKWMESIMGIYTNLSKQSPDYAYLGRIEKLKDRMYDLEYLVESSPYMTVGTPEFFVERATKVHEMGADQWLLRLDGLGHEQNMKAIRLIGTEVVPEVHKLQRERAATAG